MNLAQLIHKAVHDTVFRTALEAGEIQAQEWGLSEVEVATAAQVMRSTRGLPTDGLWTMIADYLRVDDSAQPLADTAVRPSWERAGATTGSVVTPGDSSPGTTGTANGLAHLIYKATQDAEFRQALIAGEVPAADWNVSADELAAATEVMRHGLQRGKGLGPLFNGHTAEDISGTSKGRE